LNPRAVARLILLLFASVATNVALPAQNADSFESIVKALNTRSYDDKTVTAGQLADMDDPRVDGILQALIEGRLYTQKGTDIVVFAEPLDGGGFTLTDALTSENLGEVGRRDARKISVNNRMRRQLKGLVAGRQLAVPDAEARIAAIDAITNAGDVSLRDLLIQQKTIEQDPDVMAALNTALVVFDLDDEDDAVRLAAINASGSNLHPTVRLKLTAMAADASLSEEIQAAVVATLAEIEERVSRYQMLETLFFGLSLGSILVLAAIGLAITFGVMGVINMAHGELIMLGAYTTYVVQTMFPNALEYSLFIAIPAAFIVSGLVGIAIERGVIRFLYGRPLETLLATFGVSLILQQAVRTIFSPLNRSVSTPEWMSGSLEIVQGLSVTYNRLYIFLFALLVFAALLTILQKTRLGLEVRAVTQNRQMALAMGIRNTRVDVLTFGLGAGIAGVAGVALSQLTNVGPNLGQGYIVDSFMVVVFGGVGNLWGTLVAGLSLGVVNKFLEPAAGAVVAKILVLIFIILFIQKRPRGLFPQKGRAVEN
jgi:urea transport system permease protein